MPTSLSVIIDKINANGIDDLVYTVSFVCMLSSVLNLRTSAGISQRFAGFSAVASALLFISSRKWGLFVIYLIEFIATISLFWCIRFKYYLKADRFRDHKISTFVVPASIVFGLIGFKDRNLKYVLRYIAIWFQSLSIGCQVSVTKRSRRITVLKGNALVCFIPFSFRIMCLFRRAFITHGTEMWTYWLNAMISMLLTIDFGYYVANAKTKNDDFELPGALAEL